MGCALALTGIFGISQASVSLIGPNGVSGGSIVANPYATYNVVPNSGIRVQLSQRFAFFGVNVGSQDWTQNSHVMVTLTNNQPVPVIVEFTMDSGSNGWSWSDVVIAGNTTDTIAVPLQNPQTSQNWTVWPSIDGSTNQAPLSGTVNQNSVRLLRFWNVMRQGSEDITINSLSVVNNGFRTTAIIDQYGQQTVNFPGKITNDAQLVSQSSSDSLLSGVWPYSNDAYGGVAGSGLDAGTGRWRTAKQNGKWYIIDPAGNRFFSTGIVATGAGALAYTKNRDAMFTAGAIPSQNGLYSQEFQYPVNPATGQPEAGFDFYQANLLRKFGSNWINPAMNNIAKRLRTWGFNTIGPTSHWALYSPGMNFPNMQQCGINGFFRTIPSPGSAPMPDVYDPMWTAAVSGTLMPVVNQLKNDPNNVGLFVDNELPWAFDWSQTNYQYKLAFNVLSAPADQPSKIRFYNTLMMSYRTISNLNTAWGTSFSSWAQLLSNNSFQPTNVTALMARDMQGFQNTFASQYFMTIKSKLNAFGYKGLYLGCRFYYYSPEAAAAAARYCDVVSFNAYDLTPSQWRSDLKTLNAPVMVSEFGFSAMDQGRVGGGYPGAITENDRVQAYNAYINDVKTWPNMVGLHYYKWEDEPVSGRMWDNANHTYGLVSITDVPYQQMVDAATQANTYLNNQLLNP